MKGITGMKYLFKKHIYLSYTFLFAAIAFVIYLPYIITGSSFVWHDGLWNDGYSQHYTALVYLGRYYRYILRSFAHLDPSLPQFDFAIGAGEGIIPTLNYYGLGSIFTLPSAFVSAKHAHILYCALVILRLYLAGAAFIRCCVRKGLEPLGSLFSSFTYVFCGFALFEAVRHPFFLDPMIYLPLITIGCDSIISTQKKLYADFLIPFTMCALSGFYFTYMLVIYAFVYIVTVFSARGTRPFMRSLMMVLIRFAVNFALCIMLASVIFVPSVLAFLTSGRSDGGISVSSLFLWRRRDIGAYTAGLLVPMISDTSLGMCICAVPALFLLYSNHTRETLALRRGIIIAFAAFFIPLGGFIMNGLSYPANRWSFILSFLLAYASAYTLCQYPAGRLRKAVCAVMLINMVLNGLCIYLMQGYTDEAKPFWGIYAKKTASENNYNYSGSFERKDSAYRYHENMPLIYDTPGTSEYFSIINKNYTDMLEQLEVSPAFISGFKVNGTDNRAVLDALLCVASGRTRAADGTLHSYAPPFTMPFGVAVTEYIRSEDANPLSGIQKQSLMTSAVIADTVPEDIDIERVQAVPKGIEKLDAVRVSPDSFRINVPYTGEVYIRLRIPQINKNTKFTVTTQNSKKELFILSRDHRYYLGNDEFVINLGILTEGEHTFYVNSADTPYELVSADIYDISAADAALANLSSGHMTDLEITADKISGVTNNAKDSLLLLSLPYSSGWSAYIDGAPSPVIKADYGLCALGVKGGRHKIELRYRTPGIEAGALLTLLGICATVFLAAWDKSERKN